MKRTEKIELNLNSEFERVVLFTIFTNRKSSGLTYSISRSRRQDRNHSLMSTYYVPIEKIYI